MEPPQSTETVTQSWMCEQCFSEILFWRAKCWPSIKKNSKQRWTMLTRWDILDAVICFRMPDQEIFSKGSIHLLSVNHLSVTYLSTQLHQSNSQAFQVMAAGRKVEPRGQALPIIQMISRWESGLAGLSGEHTHQKERERGRIEVWRQAEEGMI